MVDNFGTLKEVALTEVWPTEDGDFTPWLHDNLGRLGEIVGLDLEPLEIEVPVGRFALDLLARDVARGHPVP